MDRMAALTDMATCVLPLAESTCVRCSLKHLQHTVSNAPFVTGNDISRVTMNDGERDFFRQFTGLEHVEQLVESILDDLVVLRIRWDGCAHFFLLL